MPEIADTNLPVKDVIQHLAHELRQPLSALESIAFYLQMAVGGGGTAVSAQVNRLQQQVDSANWVLSDVIHLLQMAPANPNAIDVAEVTEDVFAESWVNDGLLIDQEFEDVMPRAWVDLEQFRHLLRSVMQFFRRTMEEPREVRVLVTASAGRVHLTYGGQVPELLPESLFDLRDGSQLMSCRRIAENNAGYFRAERDELGWLWLQLELPAAPV